MSGRDVRSKRRQNEKNLDVKFCLPPDPWIHDLLWKTEYSDL